jgi:hypothetical protein
VHQSRKSSFHAIRAASQKPICEAHYVRDSPARLSYKSIQMIKNEMGAEFLLDELMAIRGSTHL